ncbi:MAG TPA: pyridoxal phosphate-dependent aminotransferase [Stellaceae bacterium]|nr:pyridoxal phosphate-dependent aminotransferase [Stellaceae bacterium]
MRFSSLTHRIGGRGAGAWNVHMEARRRREAGEDVILLTVGDPDQAPPQLVVEAAVAALRGGRTGYAAILGFPAVRAAIAARVERRSGRPCAADNVVVVPGAQGGLYCALQCLAGPGDEVILGEPLYATYEAVVGASGARLVSVPLSPENRFHPDLDAIAAAIGPRTRAIWINSPHNPTGAVMTREEVEGVAQLCRRHDLWLVSDEVYEDLAFARPHTSAWSLPDMGGRTIVVSSLSKSHAIPAFRFGWIVGPSELADHLFNLLLCMTYGSPAFIQDGALAALREDLPEVAALRADYEGRAAMLSALLADAPGCRLSPPEGGMFVLLDVRGAGLGASGFALQLLQREGVAVLPCDGFGPSAAGHVRIALSAPVERLEEAGHRILRFTRALAARQGG